nr:uncharacterized protein LOC112771261 isoform X2 [Arachis hypogaea]
MVEKMNRDIREITDKIKEKISEKDYVAYGMRSSYYWKMEWRRRVARKGKILSNLYVVLDELCFMNNAPRRRSKKEKCFTEEEIDNHVRVKPGESALAFYMAENKSSTPITGVSTYNVTPMKRI